jgi:catechol 2,3-dioxygenase-like lactoylglutathione lyase family enzyme
MARLDHIELAVRDWRASRDWWRDRLGFQVEFEDPDGNLAAMRDETDLAVFLCEDETVVIPPRFSLAVQVPDVEALHRELSDAGVEFEHPPAKVFWGYGAELLDPNGYRIRLWDPTSMNAKGG